MDRLATLWLSMDARRRIVIGVATVAVFLGVLGISRFAATPSSSMLFAGLDGPAAGEVIAALESRAVAYSVKGNAIFVPAPMRDELRMSLAAEGLPATGVAGYEILDNLSGFGTTSQMFDTAYWRAVEGELARTILSSPAIRSARVHIGRQEGGPLRRTAKRSASVTVTATAGAVSKEQARALKFLVGSAVLGLSPESVSVIDGQTGRVFSDAVDESGAGSVEDRAMALKSNVERLLEARVGPGNVVVEVAVEIVTETESITERRFDPDSRVAISTETEENTRDATEPTPGVTVASNLPTGDAQAGAAGRSQNNQTRERTNYEVSETQREILKSPGAIKRLSVAVLVDAIDVVNAAGEVVRQARGAEELEGLRALVASAVGFDQARGDVIEIRSMDFEPAPAVGTVADIGLLQRLNVDVMQIVQVLVLGAVVLGLGFGVVRPIALRAAALPEASSGPFSATAVGAGDLPVLNGEIEDAGTEFELQTGGQALSPSGEASAPGSDPGHPGTEDAVERLKKMISERQDDTVDIIRGWMESDGEQV